MELPRIQNKKYYDTLLNSMEKNIRNIDAQSLEFVKKDIENIPLKNKYINNYGEFSAIELYDEIRKGICEIFSVQDDYGEFTNETYEFIIRYGTLFSAIITPALLKYFNSKMEKIYDEINRNIQEEINQLRTYYLSYYNSNKT